MSQNANALMTLPSGYGVVEGDSNIKSSGVFVPYVTFVSTKSENFPKLLQQITSLREGDAVLFQPDPIPPTKLDPTRYFYLLGTRFWAQYDQSSKIIATTFKDPGKGSAYTETVEAVILVIHDGKLIPASVRFKGPKVPGVAKAIEALKQATTPEWAEKGPDYKLSLRIPQPWARFITTASRTVKTNRTKGSKYYGLEAVVNPTSQAADCTALGNFFKDPENNKLLDTVKASYQDRVKVARLKDVSNAAA